MSYVDFVLYKSNVCGLDHSVFSNLDPVLSEDCLLYTSDAADE